MTTIDMKNLRMGAIIKSVRPGGVDEEVVVVIVKVVVVVRMQRQEDVLKKCREIYNVIVIS
jgi:hypothetical protein